MPHYRIIRTYLHIPVADLENSDDITELVLTDVQNFVRGVAGSATNNNGTSYHRCLIQCDEVATDRAASHVVYTNMEFDGASPLSAFNSGAVTGKPREPEFTQFKLQTRTLFGWEDYAEADDTGTVTTRVFSDEPTAEARQFAMPNPQDYRVVFSTAPRLVPLGKSKPQTQPVYSMNYEQI
jgi:hypothetical protein